MSIQNGTVTAHGRTWPQYERKSFRVDVLGTVPPGCADALKAELLAIGERFGLVFKVRPTMQLFMSPEDQAEKFALDEKAVAHA